MLNALLYRSPVLKGVKIMMKNVWRQKCHITRKIGDPLYTTFQKIFTIIRIFLKSEAPKAPGLFTFVHRGGLDDARNIGAARSGIPSHHGMAPERAAALQRVAFALQMLHAVRSGVPCPTFVSSWEAAALLVPPSRHSWLLGYLLLLYLLLRPRL